VCGVPVKWLQPHTPHYSTTAWQSVSFGLLAPFLLPSQGFGSVWCWACALHPGGMVHL